MAESIWYAEPNVEEANTYNKNTAVESLGIKIVEIGPDFIRATMPVDKRTVQPFGLLHGGANVLLAETVASLGANMLVDPTKYYCVGLEINANHLKSITSGYATAIGRPIHYGRTSQVWQIHIIDQEKNMTCIARMTAAVLERKA